MKDDVALAIAFLLLAVFSSIYVGRVLIEAYFRRKERFVEHLNEQLRSNPNGTEE